LDTILVLATRNADEQPQVTAVWFLWDEAAGAVKMSLNTSRQKLKNLRKRPQATVLIMDPANPYKTLEIRGQAEIAPDDDYAFATQVGAKYGGADLRSRDKPGESRVVVTLKPSKVNVWGS
jgi:PPOX class probable F420-dependent enzyme